MSISDNGLELIAAFDKKLITDKLRRLFDAAVAEGTKRHKEAAEAERKVLASLWLKAFWDRAVYRNDKPNPHMKKCAANFS